MIVLAFLLASCEPMPEPPPGVSFAFVCTLRGIPVLEGWLTVAEDVAAIADDYDVSSYWLNCQSPDMEAIRCRTRDR